MTFRPDSEPPDPGEGECPNCAHNRAYAATRDFFEDLCEGENPGSWKNLFVGSRTLAEAALLLADHAWGSAVGALCPRHAEQAKAADEELQRDSRREEGV